MANTRKNNKATSLKAEFYAQAGEYLKRARLNANVSLKDIAKWGKCTPQFIVSIEAGKAFPPPALMKVMIKNYNMNGEEFLNFIMSLQLRYYKRLYF